MNVATDDQTASPPIHPRSRSMESWRARLGILASRGEVDGPRVAEARAALSWHRTRSFLIKEGMPAEDADSFADVIFPPPVAPEPEDAPAPDAAAEAYVAAAAAEPSETVDAVEAPDAVAEQAAEAVTAVAR